MIKFLGTYSESTKEKKNRYPQAEQRSAMDNFGFVFNYTPQFSRLHKQYLFHTVDGGTKLHLLTERNNIEEQAQNLNSALFFSFVSKHSSEIASIIWFDEDSKSLYIARDLFGQIPLYYRLDETLGITFSSHIIPLINFPDKSNSVNHSSVISYFDIQGLGKPYSSATFYSKINSLLPGHILKFTNGALEIHPFVEFHPTELNEEATPTEIGRDFRTMFLQSVQNSISNHECIGIHLSGGLDSSSVAAASRKVAPEKPINTFFFDAPARSIPEEGYANDVAKKIRSNHYHILPPENQLGELYSFTKASGQPLYMIGAAGLNVGILRRARELNCDVLLTGHDGDSVVGNGNNYFNQLLDSNQWGELEFEASAYANLEGYIQTHPETRHISNKSRTELLLKRFLLGRVKRALRQKESRRTYSLLRNAYHHFNISPTYFLKGTAGSLLHSLKYQRQIPKTVLKKSIGGDRVFVDKVSLIDFSATVSGPNLEYCKGIMFGQNIRVNEDYHTMSCQFGIHIYHPFFCKALYELCLSVPQKFLFNHGYFRAPLRKAMEDLLPASVALRTNKSNFNAYSTEVAIILNRQAAHLLTKNAPIWEIVARNKYQKCLGILENPSHLSLHRMPGFFIHRVICLAVWLDLYLNNGFDSVSFTHTLDFSKRN